jgi:YHS domain-containing protein
MRKSTVYGDIFIDPVCWMRIGAERKDFWATYLARTYYFCSDACRNAFKTDPELYLDLTPPWLSGRWKPYMKRLGNALYHKH